MFEQTFLQTRAKTRKPWTVVASLSAQFGMIAVVLLIPLLHPETMRMPDVPKVRNISTWIIQPPIPQRVVARTLSIATRSPGHRFFYAPTPHPTAGPQIEVPAAESVSTEWSGPAAWFSSSVPIANVLPPATVVKPPVPPAAVIAAAGPRRVGGDVAAAKLQFGPRPAYPQIALAVHSQGTVKLEAIIAADGSIKNLRLLSGPPLLVKAAMEAVAQWKYQPTLLNGIAVEVVTEISVNFSLAH